MASYKPTYKLGWRVKVTLTNKEVLYGEVVRNQKRAGKNIVTLLVDGKGKMKFGEEKVSLPAVASYCESDIYSSGQEYRLGEGLSDSEHVWTGESWEDDEGNEWQYDDLFLQAEDNDAFIALIKEKGGWSHLEGLVNSAMQHTDDYQIAWNDFKESLQEQITEKTKAANSQHWIVIGRDMGWRNLSGTAEFHTNDVKDFMQKVFPNTDLSVYVYDWETHLSLTIYHHDSPTGESYDAWVLPAYIKEHMPLKQIGAAIRAVRAEEGDSDSGIERKKDAKIQQLVELLYNHSWDYRAIFDLKEVREYNG